MAKDSEVDERLERIAQIIELLHADECSLEEGEGLYEEGHQRLDEIRETLSKGDGEVIEISE